MVKLLLKAIPEALGGLITAAVLVLLHGLSDMRLEWSVITIAGVYVLLAVVAIYFFRAKNASRFISSHTVARFPLWARLTALGGLMLYTSMLVWLFRYSGMATVSLATLFCIISSGCCFHANREHYDEPRIRRVMFIATFAIPILTTVVYSLWMYSVFATYRPLVILVAPFEGPDSQMYRVTDILIEQLREATHRYSDIQISALRESITPQKGSEFARSIGREHNANIVVWGWYGKTAETIMASVHVELIQTFAGLPLERGRSLLKVPAAQLENFELQVQLSKEMSYFTLLVAGLARYSAGDLEGTIQRLTDALSQQAVPEQIVDSVIAYFHRGTAYSMLGDYDTAISDFNNGIALERDTATLYVLYHNRGIAYAKQGDVSRGLADLSSAISLNPQWALAYYTRGTIYIILTGEPRNGIKDLDRVIEINPGHADAYHNRGLANELEGHFDVAISDYTLGIRLRPDDADSYYNRGNSNFAMRRFDKAIGDYTQTIKIDSHYGPAYLTRGNAYRETGKLDKAILDYERVIALKRDWPDPYYNRALAFKAQGKLDESVDDLSKVITLEGERSNTCYLRGTIYAEKGDLDSAIRDFGCALILNPRFDQAYYNRGLAYKRKGETSKALADFQSAWFTTVDSRLMPEIVQRIGELGADVSVLHGPASTRSVR